jgi:hypothetical protein
MPLQMIRDNSSSSDSKSSKENNPRSFPIENVSLKPHKSTLDIDSFNVIDECDED